jgi:hypothetical protein
VNRNNILLIAIGVVGLGLSLFFIASFAVMTMFPGSRDNLEQIQGMMNLAGWSSIFSATTIGFGIYNWHR